MAKKKLTAREKFLKKLKNAKRNEIARRRRYERKLETQLETIKKGPKKKAKSLKQQTVKTSKTKDFRPGNAITSHSSIWTVKKK